MIDCKVLVGFERMDCDKVVKLLQATYWADDRSRETIITSMKNSECFGVFDGEVQVGFARVITDYSTTYYLCDVIFEEEYRNKKLGSMLMEVIVNDVRFKSLRGILGTKDAHDFYKKFGFDKNEKLFMQRWEKKF